MAKFKKVNDRCADNNANLLASISQLNYLAKDTEFVIRCKSLFLISKMLLIESIRNEEGPSAAGTDRVVSLEQRKKPIHCIVCLEYAGGHFDNHESRFLFY